MNATKIYIVTTHDTQNDEGCSHGYQCYTRVYQTYQEANDAFMAEEKENLRMPDDALQTYGTPTSLYEVTLVPSNHHTFFQQLQRLIHCTAQGIPPQASNTVLLERNWKYIQHSQWRLKAMTSPRTNAPHDPQPVSQGELS